MSPWFRKVVKELDAFCKRVDEKIEKIEKQELEEKNKTKLKSNLAHEEELNNILKKTLEELSRQKSELDQACASSSFTFTDSDQLRMDEANKTYEIAKEITGIRLDIGAPSNISKGYIKNKHR